MAGRAWRFFCGGSAAAPNEAAVFHVAGGHGASALAIQDSLCSEQHTLVLRGELDFSNTASP
jgi:hypothetical protein